MLNLNTNITHNNNKIPLSGTQNKASLTLFVAKGSVQKKYEIFHTIVGWVSLRKSPTIPNLHLLSPGTSGPKNDSWYGIMETKNCV